MKEFAIGKLLVGESEKRHHCKSGEVWQINAISYGPDGHYWSKIRYSEKDSFNPFRLSQKTALDTGGNGDYPYFKDLNMNKLGVALNLSQPKATELAKRLVGIGDVVVESFTPGVMSRLGLDYKVLRSVNPSIVMLSTSANGSTGPEARYAGYAPMFNATSGLGEMTGYPDGPPTVMRITIDNLVAHLNAFAILAALIYRQETGEGQYIDASSQEAIACLIGDSIMDYTMNGRVQSRDGNRDEIMAPHNCYRCLGEDRWISPAVSTEEEW